MLNFTQEKGQPIEEWEDLYEISTFGRVSNYRKVMQTWINNSGYECVTLSKKGQRKHYLVHRLVAKAFIPNPDDKPEVNHIDGNKFNNCKDNLEWVTSAENKQHARQSGLAEYNKPSTGIKLGRSSKYHYVTWDKSRNKWVATIRHNNVNHFPKRFDTEDEAALHANWIIDQLGLTDRPKNIV